MKNRLWVVRVYGQDGKQITTVEARGTEEKARIFARRLVSSHRGIPEDQLGTWAFAIKPLT